MKIPFFSVTLVDFSEMDKQIDKLKELRDSYLASNRAFYGEQLAKLLDG